MPNARLIKKVDFFSLELTNICNLDCDFCANRLMTRKKGMMDLGLAKRIIREVKQTGFCNEITTNVMGEPLLYKDIFELLKYARQLKQDVVLITNGEKLDSQAALNLFKYPPAQFLISYHCGSEKSYSHKNSPSTYEEYRNRIFDFVELKYKLKSNVPIYLYVISTYNMPHDKFRILEDKQEMRSLENEWIDFAKRIKRQYNVSCHTPDAIYPGSNMLLPGFYITLSLFYHLWMKSILPSGTRVIPSQESSCNWPFIQCNVLWNGDLTLCCTDYNGDLAYDNIRDKSIIEAFNSDKAIEIRKNFANAGNIPERCSHCYGKLVDADGLDYNRTKRIYKLTPWENFKRRYFRLYRFFWKITNLGSDYKKLMLYINIHHWWLRKQYRHSG